MGKYNKKSEAVKPTVTNCMGEMAYALTAKEELVSTVLTTFLGDSYYEKETEIVKRITTKLAEVDPLFAAKLALYARQQANMRSVTHLIAATIAPRLTGLEWSGRFYNKIVVRPDDMSEIVSCYANMNKMDLKKIRRIPNSVKRGFKKALERLDAYQIDKYKMNNRQVTMIDLVNLFHPKPTQKNNEAYKNLLTGKSLAGLYTTKVLEKEMSKAGQNKTSQADVDAAKSEAIADVLDNVAGMPIMNLLRNLRNIITMAPDKVDEACRQLRIREKILKSRLLPFRFATAYAEIEKMSNGTTTSIAFEKDGSDINTLKKKVLDAIEDALQIACENIPTLEGNVAILVDHSGSCRGDGGGSSRVSAFSKTTTAMIGNLFASMLAWKQDNVYIGLFGDKLINVPIIRDQKLLDFNKQSFDMGAKCGGATEQGIYDFFSLAINEKKKIDNVVVFSDCQIGSNGSTPWYGVSHDTRSPKFQQMITDFKKINPFCNIIAVDLRQTKGNNVFHKSQRIMNIAGWSDKIFDVITSNAKGYDAIIKEIESIEI